MLFPKKGKIKKHKIASFDVETADIDNNFYMVGLYYDDIYKVFYNIDSFYNYLKSNLKGYWVIATNLAFDLTSCFFNSKYWTEFDIIENSGFMLLASSNTLNIKFLDTLNWHKAGVEELGKIVNIQKLPHPEFLGKRKPENNKERVELINYNKQDCEITYRFSLWMQDQINSMGGELKITLASTSMDLWRRKYQSNVIVKEDFIIKDKDIKNKIFNAYYGGRTECLKRGYFEDLYYYDFNSLYPSVMINKLPLPNSVTYHKKGSISDIYSKEGVSFVSIEHLTDELPLLPYRHDGKLTFPTGKLKGWWTHLEIRKAIENGYLLHDVYETISYSISFFPFRSYIENLYSLRLKAKEEKSSTQLIYKLLMNSLYGKFGERKHNVIDHFDLSMMSQKEKDQLNSNHIKSVSFNEDGKGYATWEEECNSAHVFPILPVYITAMGRIKLWEKARTLDPIYMDTDSIVTKEKLAYSNKLGDIDMEHYIDKAIFIKPKMYYFIDGDKEVIRLKGVPHVTKKQFLEVLEGSKISYNKFVKLKEGIRRNLKVNSIIGIDKDISLEDTKRIWKYPFSLEAQDSMPINIIEEDNYEIRQCVLLHEVNASY